SDVKGLINPSPLDANTALDNAISALVEKCNAAPADTQSYRKLRMFSGVKPTPSGEEEYDAWAEQTVHLLEEWQCSDSVKKQRIVESLKGPAADILRFLKVQNPIATAHDYMRALETAFGTTESSADLLVKFRHTFQWEGENLSAYLLRLDKLLHCVFRKGGVPLAEMNKLRIEQIVRGALPHDMVALRIRMTHKLREPPTFNDLLKEVREEEDMLQSRNDVKSAVASKTVNPVFKPVPETSDDPELEKLRKDISVMKAEMINLRAATVSPQLDVQNSQPEFQTKVGYRRNDTSQKTANAGDRPVLFCYRCGEDGHFKRECRGEENLKRVNKRLIKQTKSGNYRGNQ
ncbi:putative paraneoplastic antigen Ma1-like protein, partial [Triplophysa rosa]